jgi:hypothetical protein
MANKHIGEVPLQVGDKTLIMRMTVREIVRLEQVYAKSWNDCVKLISPVVTAENMQSTEHIKIGDICQFLRASLSFVQPELTEEGVFDIATEVGILKVVQKLSEALVEAQPKREAAEGEARPA